MRAPRRPPGAMGLKKGERVVVEGTQKVRDGILVELLEAGEPTG